MNEKAVREVLELLGAFKKAKSAIESHSPNVTDHGDGGFTVGKILLRVFGDGSYSIGPNGTPVQCHREGVYSIGKTPVTEHEDGSFYIGNYKVDKYGGITIIKDS